MKYCDFSVHYKQADFYSMVYWFFISIYLSQCLVIYILTYLLHLVLVPSINNVFTCLSISLSLLDLSLSLSTFYLSLLPLSHPSTHPRLSPLSHFVSIFPSLYYLPLSISPSFYPPSLPPYPLSLYQSLSPSLSLTHLYPGLSELGSLGQLLPGVDVRVVSPLKRSLQVLQLLRGEGRSTPPLLTFELQAGL